MLGIFKTTLEQGKLGRGGVSENELQFFDNKVTAF
jgi:hypothetical protein